MRENTGETDFRRTQQVFERIDEFVGLDAKPVQIGVHFNVNCRTLLPLTRRGADASLKLPRTPECELDVGGQGVVECVGRNRAHDENRRRDAGGSQRDGLIDGKHAEPRREGLDHPCDWYQSVAVGVALHDEGRAVRPNEIAQRLRVVSDRAQGNLQAADHEAHHSRRQRTSLAEERRMDRLDEHLRWIVAAPIYGAAYAVAAAIFWRMARRRGMATDGIARVMAAGLIGGLAGANLLQLLATGLPGKAIEGGIVGGWLAVIWMKRRLGITRPTGDLFALAIPAGEAIGRIACFIGGCCFGKAATLAWAVHDHGAWRHPAQLYLSIAAAASFAILLVIERRASLAGERPLLPRRRALLRRALRRRVLSRERGNRRRLDPRASRLLHWLWFFAWKFVTLVRPRFATRRALIAYR